MKKAITIAIANNEPATVNLPNMSETEAAMANMMPKKRRTAITIAPNNVLRFITLSVANSEFKFVFQTQQAKRVRTFQLYSSHLRNNPRHHPFRLQF
jgi:hypothetical protein